MNLFMEFHELDNFFRSLECTISCVDSREVGVEGLKDFWAHKFCLGEGGCVSGWQICDQQHSLSRDLGTIG